MTSLSLEELKEMATDCYKEDICNCCKHKVKCNSLQCSPISFLKQIKGE